MGVPPQTRLQLNILESRPEILAPRTIFPVPPSVSFIDDSLAPMGITHQASEIYKNNRFYPPQWAEISEEAIIRNRRIVRCL